MSASIREGRSPRAPTLVVNKVMQETRLSGSSFADDDKFKQEVYGSERKHMVRCILVALACDDATYRMLPTSPRRPGRPS